MSVSDEKDGCGMEPLFESYLERFERLHAHIEKAIEGLPEPALDWIPGPEMNSINVLVVHLTGAERYWIGDVAMGESSGRDREAEFRTQGLGVDALNERLARITDYIRRVLIGMTTQDLGEERVSSRDGERITVASALLHALDHAAIHVGHVQMTRQLWDQRSSGE
jgi:uncharacterized damage-inducible protein DinB